MKYLTKKEELEALNRVSNSLKTGKGKGKKERKPLTKKFMGLFFHFKVYTYTTYIYSCGCTYTDNDPCYTDDMNIMASDMNEAIMYLKHILGVDEHASTGIDYDTSTCKELHGDVYISIYIEIEEKKKHPCGGTHCLENDIDVDYSTDHEFFYNNNEEYVVKDRVDRLFNYYIYTHGLNAFRGGVYKLETVVDSVNGIINNRNWQICCSRKQDPIGPYGLYIKGDVLYYSNNDLYSYIDEYGNRLFDREHQRLLIHSPNEIDNTVWNHSEAVITNSNIVGVWIKEWFMESEKVTDKKIINYLKKFAKENGLIFHIRGGRFEN